MKAKNIPKINYKVQVLDYEEANRLLIDNFESTMVDIFVNYIKNNKLS